MLKAPEICLEGWLPSVRFIPSKQISGAFTFPARSRLEAEVRSQTERSGLR